MKTFLTFLNRNKLFSVVNVAGLSISLMFVLLIGDMVRRQLTVDADVKAVERISILTSDSWNAAHYHLGDLLQQRFPEIEDWCAVSTVEDLTGRAADQSVMKVSGLFVRENFYDFFGYRLLEGNPAEALCGDRQVILTRPAAIKLFGTDRDVIGREVYVNELAIQEPFIVSALAEPFDNSLFKESLDVILPYKAIKDFNRFLSPDETNMSNGGGTLCFFRSIPGKDLSSKEKEVTEYLKEHFWAYQDGHVKEARFIPMRSYYYHDDKCYSDINRYDIKLVWLFLATGVLILLMAVFNYVSMSVAQTTYRAKEMAMRRLLGSQPSHIFWRMIGEAALLTLLAVALAFLLALAAEPLASELFDHKLDLLGDLNAVTLLAYLLVALLLGFLAGFFPATLLSRYNPLQVVKGDFRRKTKGIYLRLLTIVQNGLTMAILACSLHLALLLWSVSHADLGYRYGHVLIYGPFTTEQEEMIAFRSELLQHPFVRRVSFSEGVPVQGGNNWTMQLPSADSTCTFSFQIFKVDSTFCDIYHIPLHNDRNSQIENGYFASQETMERLEKIGMGQRIADRYGNRMDLVGTFPDFKIRSLLSTDDHPLLIGVRPVAKLHPWHISVEVQDGDLADYKRQLDACYQRFAENCIPCDSQWYDVMTDQLYTPVYRLAKLMTAFTFAALVIALLGLSAMNLYYISQRKRDMAVRKVFGSDTRREQWALMRFSFVTLGFSLLISLPLMWVGVKQIDKIVVYNAPFSPWVVVCAVLFVALITFLSVFCISYRAVRENPILHIKTE